MHVQFVGSGDAFGSGGRRNACFHVVGAETNFLIDCGATSLVGLNELGIDANAIDAILLTHFHADHFGGVPFFLAHAQTVAQRTRPLTLVGPPGLPARYTQWMDVAFPSFQQTPEHFALTMREVEIGKACLVGQLSVTAFPVVHVEAAGPCLGYRIEAEGRVIAYSGDSEWTESLVEIGREADLFICEAYTRVVPVKSHNSLAMIERHLDRIRPKRLVLTHMSTDMLAHIGKVPYVTAADGMVVEI